MVAQILRLPWLAFRHGQICGVPITRNPIAWIPFFVAVPFVLLLWVVLCALYLLAMPFVIIGGYFSARSFRRKAGVFSDEGIHFPTAYNRRTIPWSDIREVVFEIGYTTASYRIVCDSIPGQTDRYVMAWTQDDEAFERTLTQRNIPFRVHDWRYRPESPAAE